MNMKRTSICIEVNTDAVRKSIRSDGPVEPVAHLAHAICKAVRNVTLVAANKETRMLELAGPVLQVIEIQRWIIACQFGAIIAQKDWEE